MTTTERAARFAAQHAENVAAWTKPTCVICGAIATCMSPYRSCFPRRPHCEKCVGPVPQKRTFDAWGEFYPYPLNTRLPMQLDR